MAGALDSILRPKPNVFWASHVRWQRHTIVEGPVGGRDRDRRFTHAEGARARRPK